MLITSSWVHSGLWHLTLILRKVHNFLTLYLWILPSIIHCSWSKIFQLSFKRFHAEALLTWLLWRVKSEESISNTQDIKENIDGAGLFLVPSTTILSNLPFLLDIVFFSKKLFSFFFFFVYKWILKAKQAN